VTAAFVHGCRHAGDCSHRWRSFGSRRFEESAAGAFWFAGGVRRRNASAASEIRQAARATGVAVTAVPAARDERRWSRADRRLTITTAYRNPPRPRQVVVTVAVDAQRTASCRTLASCAEVPSETVPWYASRQAKVKSDVGTRRGPRRCRVVVEVTDPPIALATPPIQPGTRSARERTAAGAGGCEDAEVAGPVTMSCDVATMSLWPSSSTSAIATAFRV